MVEKVEFKNTSRRERAKMIPKSVKSWAIINDGKDETYWNFINNHKEIFGRHPLMFADCKITLKNSQEAEDPRFVTIYHGYPYEDHTHHIVIRTKGGYDISVNKVDLYTGLAIIEKEVV